MTDPDFHYHILQERQNHLQCHSSSDGVLGGKAWSRDRFRPIHVTQLEMKNARDLNIRDRSRKKLQMMFPSLSGI